MRGCTQEQVGLIPSAWLRLGWRRAAVAGACRFGCFLDCHTWFERISMLVILLNCVTLGMFRPCEDMACDSQRCRILQVSLCGVGESAPASSSGAPESMG